MSFVLLSSMLAGNEHWHICYLCTKAWTTHCHSLSAGITTLKGRSESWHVCSQNNETESPTCAYVWISSNDKCLATVTWSRNICSRKHSFHFLLQLLSLERWSVFWLGHWSSTVLIRTISVWTGQATTLLPRARPTSGGSRTSSLTSSTIKWLLPSLRLYCCQLHSVSQEWGVTEWWVWQEMGVASS